MNKYLLIHSCTSGLAWLCLSAVAPADTSKIDFSADAGFEYDSNVNVQELDTTANAADIARLLNASLQGTWAATDKLTFKGGYRYADKSYREYDGFNQTIDTWSAEMSYEFAHLTTGLTYHRADADLAADPFLRLNRNSVYAGKLIKQTIYLRGAYYQQEKSLTDNSGRNADGAGVDADVFFFFNNARGFLSLGLGNGGEDARENIYDLDARTFRGRLSNRFSLWGKSNQVQLGFRLAEKDYTAFNPGIGAKRRDKQRVVDASWKLFFNDYWSAIATLEQGDYQSNLGSADYDETLVSFQIQAKF